MSVWTNDAQEAEGHLEKAFHAAQSATDLQLLHSNWGAVLMHMCVVFCVLLPAAHWPQSIGIQSPEGGE